MTLNSTAPPSGTSKPAKGPRKCLNWLETYLQYTAASESPDNFHFWSGVSTIGSAARSKVWFNMGLFEWTPNFFLFLVAPPGLVSKSTSAGLATDLLKEVDGITFGPSSVTWQALIDYFQQCHIQWHPPGMSILDKGLDMSCMTIVASELGTFFNPDDRELVDALVHLYDGKRDKFKRTTISRGDQIAVNPWLNLIACTTPRWISEHMSAHFTGGGFSSRSIFVYSEAKRKLVSYPFLEFAPNRAVLEKALITDLQRIGQLYGEFKGTPDMLAAGDELYRQTYEDLPIALTNEQKMGYLSRKQTHAHKLAMCLSMAEGDDLILEEHHIRRAYAELDAIEPDMLKVFSSGKAEEIAGLQEKLLLEIFAAGRVPRNAHFQNYFRVISYETYNKAVDALVNSEFCILRQEGGQIWIERNDKNIPAMMQFLRKQQANAKAAAGSTP